LSLATGADRRNPCGPLPASMSSSIPFDGLEHALVNSSVELVAIHPGMLANPAPTTADTSTSQLGLSAFPNPALVEAGITRSTCFHKAGYRQAAHQRGHDGNSFGAGSTLAPLLVLNVEAGDLQAPPQQAKAPSWFPRRGLSVLINGRSFVKGRLGRNM